MGRKRTTGLILRGGIWHIDKKYRGRRLRESTGESSYSKAEEHLTRRLEQLRRARVFGERPERNFRQAATRYLNEATKATLADDAMLLKQLDRHIGHLRLDQVHMGTLAPYIEERRAQGVKAGTINHGLQVVRRITRLAAGEWMDEYGLTWLAGAPMIRFVPITDRRAPYPLSWDEQAALFKELPGYLARMALFKVNTGCREQEVCRLRWDWEVEVPELGTSVFLIPGEFVKNREERLVVLNRVARSVIEEVRGMHPEHVFIYRDGPVGKMNGVAWRKARERAGLPQVRVHDLKHTFGRRLRAAGVSFEDRQDLLGHSAGRITTHYSAAELGNLLQAAEAVCGEKARKTPTLTVLRRRATSGGSS